MFLRLLDCKASSCCITCWLSDLMACSVTPCCSRYSMTLPKVVCFSVSGGCHAFVWPHEAMYSVDSFLRPRDNNDLLRHSFESVLTTEFCSKAPIVSCQNGPQQCGKMSPQLLQVRLLRLKMVCPITRLDRSAIMRPRLA